MRIVADTTVLIRAHNRSRSLARKILHEILEHDHRLILSNKLIAETVRVLRYPHFQELYGLSDQELLAYAQFLQSVADIVILDPRYQAPRMRDPYDAHVLQTAELGDADILCTGKRSGRAGENSRRDVRRALADAEHLIQRNGATSAVDRVHTALHGYQIDLCADAGIAMPADASLTQAFKLLRTQHPAFQATGPRSRATRIGMRGNGNLERASSF